MGDYYIDDVCIGNLAKIAGNPPSVRWIAQSIYPSNAGMIITKRFPTRAAGASWLKDQHERQSEQMVSY